VGKKMQPGDEEGTRVWLTVRQLSELYNISVATIERWLKNKDLNPSNGAHKFGHQWRINRTEFDNKFKDAEICGK
jgi:excisionase family DNA binding protein